MKMKAILKLLLVALFTASMLLMVSCSHSSCFVNFDADGGSTVDSIEVKHGETIGEAPVTAKEGYTFDGWYLNNDKWDFEHYAVTKNMTLKARWIKNHTVSFNSDGGSQVESVIAVDGTKIAAPVNPIKEGAEFLGWFLGDTKWNFTENAITEDLTLTAKWRNKFTVKFNSDGGSVIAAQTAIKSGELATKPTDPTRHGSAFAGWFAFDEATHTFMSDTPWDFATPITANVTLKAKWIPIYTVSFDTYGAGKIDSIKLLHGALIPAPAAITKDGYIFEGWYNGEVLWDFNAPVTANVKLVAKWTAITYSVTLDKDTGEEPLKLDIRPGDKVPEPETPTLEGYAFLGWYIFNAADESLSAAPWNFETDTITAELTLKAKWIKTWTVNFEIDGAVTESFTIHEGTLIQAPEENPEKDGAAFIGWYNEATVWNFATPVTSDVTLTAKFLEKYTVKFDLDGASSATIPLEVELLFGEKVTRPSVDPEKPGYLFDGWYFGDVLWNFDSPVTSNVTLKAKWSKLFRIEFSDNGTVISTAQVAAGHKIPVPEVPTKHLYLFSNWQTQDKTVWNFDTDVVSGNMTLFATWTDNYWLITFDTDGAGEIAPVKIERGELIPKPADPEKEKVGFEGWVYATTGNSVDFTKAPTSDITLKAKWTDEFFTVQFKNNNVVVKTKYVAYTNPYLEELDIELEAPDDESRYKFLGWTASVGDGSWDFATDRVTGNMEFHANWRKVFVVTLKLSDTQTYETMEVFEGKPAGFCLPPIPRADAVFAGWVDENGKDWDLATKLVTDNITLYAKWLPSATVRYELLGGYFEDSSFLGYETVILKDGEDVFFTEPAVPKKSKYIFGGWFLAGTTESWIFTEDVAVQGEIMLVAKWIPLYYVNFNLSGGEGSFNQQLVETGKTATEPTAAPTKEYMIFKGWYLGEELYDFSTPVTSDITLIAKWARETFEVTFDDTDGEGGGSYNFDAGKTISAPTSVTLENYVVKEWQLPDGTVWNFNTDILTGPITLKAIWTNENVTISFDLKGGTLPGGNTVVPSQTVIYNSLLNKFDTPYMGSTDSDYIFKGWYRPDGTKWNFDTDLATKSLTLTAVWGTHYVITFETDNGVYETQNVNSGELTTPPLIPPTKLGYTFIGWFVEGTSTKWDFTTMPINEDLVLVAGWELDKYTVTFVTRVPDSEELRVLGTQKVKYGDFIICPETPFIGENYQFNSWRDTKGNVWNFSVDTVTGDITIQAYWVTPGTGAGGGVTGPWDEGTATRGPIDDFS